MIRTASLASLLALLPAAAAAQDASDAALSAKASEAEQAAMAEGMRVGPIVGQPAPAASVVAGPSFRRDQCGDCVTTRLAACLPISPLLPRTSVAPPASGSGSGSGCGTALCLCLGLRKIPGVSRATRSAASLPSEPLVVRERADIPFLVAWA